MNKDFIPGKHNYKEWFKIMWENNYLPLGIVFFVMSILQVTHLRYCMNLLYVSDHNWLVELGMWIFPSGLTFIVFFGFIDFWRYLKGQDRIYEIITRWVKKVILTKFYGWENALPKWFKSIYLMKSSEKSTHHTITGGQWYDNIFTVDQAWERQFKKSKKS